MMEGTYDDMSKTMNFTGTMTDPMTGNDMKVKQVMAINSPDLNTFKMFIDIDGQEYKTMEILYTRVKD